MSTVEADQLPLVLHLAKEDPGDREEVQQFFIATTQLSEFYDQENQIIPNYTEIYEQKDALRPLMTNPDPGIPETISSIGSQIVVDDGGSEGD